MAKQLRGLATASPETRRRVAKMGGAATASKPGHMAKIGKLGGDAVAKDRGHMAKIGRIGGSSTVEKGPAPSARTEMAKRYPDEDDSECQ